MKHSWINGLNSVWRKDMKVRIGSIDYNLTQKEAMYTITDCGFCDWEDGIIAINPTKPHECKKQTFWHEAVHAMLTEIGEDNGLSKDEKFVDSFSKQLYAFHKDNKLEKIYQVLI